MAPKKAPLSAKQRMMETKRIVLKIVESMLEENISPEWFLANCSKLSQTDYDDVIQERSIEHICGYPVCSKPIQKIIKQQYRISANKIYDITERKNFCSDECYKASNFLKVQLHTLPLYLRKTEEPLLILKLLSDSENCGSAGQELVFQRSISKDEIEEKNGPVSMSVNLNKILQQDIKDCTEHLADLEIKENIYREKYVFGGEKWDKTPEDDDEAAENEMEDSQNSDSDDRLLFQDYDNVSVLSNKLMPVPDKAKKTVLIEPLKAVVKNLPLKSTKLNIDFLSKVFQDWFTEDTMKYLLGEKQVYSIKAENLFKTMVMTNQSPEELTCMKEEYVNLCLKINKLPDEEDNLSDLSDTTEIGVSENSTVKSSSTTQDKLEKLSLEADSKSVPAQKILKRRTKRNTGKKKSVSFTTGVKSQKIETDKLFVDPDSTTSLETTLPLVDSLSQNTLRKQILTSKLKSAYLKILPIIDLHYRDIKEEVHCIVDTFSLSPTNIVYKPKQQEYVGIVLFRILTKTKIKELLDDSQFTKLCKNIETISQEEIEKLVCDLISINQVLRLHKS